MRFVAFALALAVSPSLRAAAAPSPTGEAPPFLLTLTDPTNSHFATASLKNLQPAVQKTLGHPEVARVKAGPEVGSVQEAHDFAARDGARFYLFAQCGLVIELLKVCDAHIKYCAHSCEAWLFETASNRQLGHAKVTGEKGGTDAVQKLLAQLAPTVAPLTEPVAALLQAQAAEKQASAEAKRLAAQAARADKERRAAEDKARREREKAEALAQKAAAAEEKARLQAEARRLAQEEAELKKRNAEADRLAREAEAAAKKLEAERRKRESLEKAQASRAIHLVPGQTVAVLEVENDLTGGAKNQVNFQTLTDNLRKRVTKSGLGLLVMDRDAIFQILSANEKQVLECQANCETQLGRILKSDYVISGRLGRQGPAFRLYLLMYRSSDGALLSDAVATSQDLASLDRQAAIASTDLLSVFPVTR